MKCPNCGYVSASRSSNQNRWYWSCIVEMIMREVGYATAEECHEDLKRKFNPIASKLDPEILIGGSTTLLSTKDFSDYCERICVWALEYFGLDIPRPHQADPVGEYK
jgi:hypothetical protein